MGFGTSNGGTEGWKGGGGVVWTTPGNVEEKRITGLQK